MSGEILSAGAMRFSEREAPPAHPVPSAIASCRFVVSLFLDSLKPFVCIDGDENDCVLAQRLTESDG